MHFQFSILKLFLPKQSKLSCFTVLNGQRIENTTWMEDNMAQACWKGVTFLMSPVQPI